MTRSNTSTARGGDPLVNIGKIVSDVEIIRLDDLETENAPAEPTTAEAKPESVPAG